MVGAASRWSMPIRRQAAGRSELARRRSPQPLPARQSAQRAPTGTLTLHFQPHTRLAYVDAPLPQNISAVAVVGRTLFAACDETATVERLVRTSDGDYYQQDSIALGDHFELPEGRAGEMDIEGLAIDGDALWITGSHSLKRDKPDLATDDNAKALDELAEIDRNANRYFLGRLPLMVDHGGVHRPARSKGKAGGSGGGCLKMRAGGGNALTKVLYRDRHLAPSVGMPCKENGFDIEGLAVKDERVFLGLRGPVLRGWAVVIELRIKRTKAGRLKLGKCAKGRRYLKHFLPLKGLGIRDLRFDGDDLVVLAGPTMDHDGTGALFRWGRPIGAADDMVHAPADVLHLMDLPYARDADQAEGVTFVEVGGARRLLIVHDSPAAARLGEAGESLVVDLFDLEQSSRVVGVPSAELDAAGAVGVTA
jgi:Protein of unknown function (DUF3616)